MDDAQLRTLHERLMYLRNLEEKKEQVLASIEEQGKLTEELKKQILAAETMVVVEDLYRPYRPKRRTRAMIAKEKGLEPLAALITLQKAEKPIEVYAEEYVNSEKEVKSVKEAIDGAKDIIAESVSDEADYRSWIRKATIQHGKVISQAKDEKAESVYEMYYDFEEPRCILKHLFCLLIFLYFIIQHLIIQETATSKCLGQQNFLFFCWINPKVICYIQYFFSPCISIY